MTESSLPGDRPNVVVVSSKFGGDSPSFEFREAISWLENHCSVERVASFGALARLLENSSTDPWAVVVMQQYKGEFDHVDAAAIAQAIPLSRLVVLLGSWCEGETRTGKPLAGFVRIGWCDFVPRFSGLIHHKKLPSTASDGETLQSAMEYAESAVDSGLCVGVYSASYDDGRAIHESLESLGFVTRRLLRGDFESTQRLEVDIVVWDDAGGPRTRRVELGMATGKGIPVIAVINAPRSQDVRSALLAEAHAVLAKPYRVADLVWRIQSAAVQPVAVARRA